MTFLSLVKHCGITFVNELRNITYKLTFLHKQPIYKYKHCQWGLFTLILHPNAGDDGF